MNLSLCPYKNLFGEPNTGPHKYRIFDIAVIDVLSTIAVCYGIAYFFKLNFKYVLIIGFLLGIIMHRLFCVRTTVDKLLFP
jgi:hypothetical protein